MNSRTPTDRICPQRPSRRPGGGRIATLLVTSCLAWSGMALPLGAARAQSGLPDNSADTGFAALKARANIQAAQRAVAAQPNDEAAVRNLIEALARGGRNADALAEADRFVSRGTATAALRTQRGFLRRQLGDLPGAVEDFTAALKGPGLSADQRATVQAGLAEAQAAQSQGGLDRAQADLARGDFAGAATAARLILESNPGSESAMRIRVEALTAAGRTREALAEAEKFAGRAGANPLLRAQRGFLRRGFDDPHGAAEDFAAALAGDGLTAEQRRNLEAGLAEAKVAEAQTELDRADAALSRGDLQGALAASRKALERDAGSEAATRIRVEALSRLGRKRDAATEADGFIARNAASALMRAQREFIRRELNDTAGAIEDFSSALAGDGLSPEQKRNVQAALAEARSAGQQGSPAPAAAAQPRPKTEAETQADENRLLAEGTAPGWLYAKRGNARFDAHDYRGAVADFDRALARGDLDRSSVPGIRYARAQAGATQAEREDNPQAAEDVYRRFLDTDPAHADAWYKLGYLLLKQKHRPQAVDALGHGLAIRPTGAAALDAANAAIFTNAPLASQLYRQGLEAWYVRDASLSDKTQTDLERVRNETVQADASLRTSIGIGAIVGRPQTAGGTNDALGGERSVRFDGRYLPPAPGLEAFGRGLTDKDANGVRESDVATGLRLRPIDDLNLYFSGAIEHFYQPKPITELVLNWGLGLGENPYPYTAGWKPYWDFGTIGGWRTTEHRLLEDTRGNVGFLYEVRAPFRGAIGPTLLAVAGYDNKAATPFASGIGPSVLTYFWLGGDRYRSYDAVVSLQAAYVFNVGPDERQKGWRGLAGVTF